MNQNRQRDLFLPDEQPELFEDLPSQAYRADPDVVRTEMRTLLAELRAAKTMPWTQEDVGFYQTVFPQMSRWLPEEEAAQLCLEFETELKRLKAA